MNLYTMGLISTHMATLMERNNSWSHILGTQIASIQGFGAPNFHICH